MGVAVGDARGDRIGFDIGVDLRWDDGAVGNLEGRGKALEVSANFGDDHVADDEAYFGMRRVGGPGGGVCGGREGIGHEGIS